MQGKLNSKQLSFSSNHVPPVSCVLSAHNQKEQALPFHLSRIFPSWKLVPDRFQQCNFLNRACCSSTSNHHLLCQGILKHRRRPDLYYWLLQICKHTLLHYLHIHLGLCLLMQNCPKVQLPRFCHRPAICYPYSPLRQTGFPASREDPVGRTGNHFLFLFISALKHLQKVQS